MAQIWRMCGRSVVAVAAMAGLCLAVSAQEAPMPRFDVEGHCKEVAEFAGGSQQLYGFCFDEEQDAYNHLKPLWSGLGAKMRDHCEEVARFSGSSYQLLDFCIGEELKAAGDNAGKTFKF